MATSIPGPLQVRLDHGAGHVSGLLCSSRRPQRCRRRPLDADRRSAEARLDDIAAREGPAQPASARPGPSTARQPGRSAHPKASLSMPSAAPATVGPVWAHQPGRAPPGACRPRPARRGSSRRPPRRSRRRRPCAHEPPSATGPPPGPPAAAPRRGRRRAKCRLPPASRPRATRRPWPSTGRWPGAVVVQAARGLQPGQHADVVLGRRPAEDDSHRCRIAHGASPLVRGSTVPGLTGSGRAGRSPRGRRRRQLRPDPLAGAARFATGRPRPSRGARAERAAVRPADDHQDGRPWPRPRPGTGSPRPGPARARPCRGDHRRAGARSATAASSSSRACRAPLGLEL